MCPGAGLLPRPRPRPRSRPVRRATPRARALVLLELERLVIVVSPTLGPALPASPWSARPSLASDESFSVRLVKSVPPPVRMSASPARRGVRGRGGEREAGSLAGLHLMNEEKRVIAIPQ